MVSFAKDLDVIFSSAATPTIEFLYSHFLPSSKLSPRPLIFLRSFSLSRLKREVDSRILKAVAIENSKASKIHENNNNEPVIPIVDVEDGIVRTPHASPDTADKSTSLLENTGSIGSYNDILKLYGPLDLNAVSCRNNSFNRILIGEENVGALLVPSSSQEQMAEALRAGLHSKINDHSTGSKKLEKGSIELKSQQDPISDMGDIEDDTVNPVVSGSSQTCRIDLHEEVIEDAKNNEKTLFQVMQSLMVKLASALPIQVEWKEASALPIQVERNEASALPIQVERKEASALSIQVKWKKALALLIQFERKEGLTLPIQVERKKASTLPIQVEQNKASALPIQVEWKEASTLPIQVERKEASALSIQIERNEASAFHIQIEWKEASTLPIQIKTEGSIATSDSSRTERCIALSFRVFVFSSRRLKKLGEY
ncbi:hypothetical protein F3Y22_tig00111388pilonHSYRG00202 [Hibiscus syriacus]|uniref:Uncharacterized protein n=1 Tax=Hibiscus syriacus TaxID=106335 RepID=A0A6A2YMC7_HIBSY|nr:hypothetical protein F3Y22_tig00111388pilonHSYRG00202 [Hibiscus syriacus]